MTAFDPQAARDALRRIALTTEYAADVRLLRLAIERAAAQPIAAAEDEREAVARAVFEADEPTVDYERKLPYETEEIHTGEPWRYYLGIADRLIAMGFSAASALAPAAEVRPRGPVTDAEVSAAQAVIASLTHSGMELNVDGSEDRLIAAYVEGVRDAHGVARAALEAAWEVRP